MKVSVIQPYYSFDGKDNDKCYDEMVRLLDSCDEENGIIVLPEYSDVPSDLIKEEEYFSMVISQTPYRISFFGGGTDYTEYFIEHGGSVISTTIDRYCYLTLRRLPPFFEHQSRLSYSKIELFNHA